MLNTRPLARTPAVATTSNARLLPGENASRIGPDPDADIEDMALLAHGDTAALGRLYDRYARATFAAAFQLLQDAAAAEDAVQDTYLRAWRSAASYQRCRGSVRSWLVSIARHSAIDHLRARSVAQRYQPLLAHRELPNTFDDPALESLLVADVQRLQAALDTLPRDQRQAIELAFFSGLTHKEIALRTGVPLGTVKGRVRLGMRRLRETLDDSEVTAPASVEQPGAAQPVQLIRQ